MNQKIKIGSKGGIVTLSDKNYRTAGGEANIYVNGGMVYKLYHEPDKKMLPLKKMSELSLITNPQVVLPQEVVYDSSNGKPLGYTTKFVDDAEPLVKLYTRTFKDANNISPSMITELTKQLQLVVADVHAAQCLIVDLNELNVLAKINPSNIIPWFIDTDSYSTPSFKATAIMDSVRDRKYSVIDKNGVLHYHPTVESDWFSWAILAFYLYTNIHPFKGNHPKYKPNQKKEQMDDGVSVFHPGVRTPPHVNNFNVIPPRHLDYFKRVFFNNERGVPPLPDSNIPLLVPTQIITIKGTDRLDVIDIGSFDSNVMAVYNVMGVNYTVTKKHIYAGNKEIGTHNEKKMLLCSANNGSLITATLSGTKVTFGDLTSNVPIGTTTSNDMFSRNGSIYTISAGKLIENSFMAFGTKIIHRSKEIENVSLTSAVMYDGCVIQDLLGKKYLTLPYQKDSCFSKYIPNLDGYRIVGAKSDKYVTVVLAEKGGIFSRFIIVFDKKYANFTVREVKDVTYDTINFCTMDNGLCVLLSSDTELELFATTTQCEVFTNPPFDSSMKLFTTSDGIFFINQNSIHQLKKK